MNIIRMGRRYRQLCLCWEGRIRLARMYGGINKYRMKWFTFLWLILPLFGQAQPKLAVIPEPVLMQERGGMYTLPGGKLVYSVLQTHEAAPPEGYQLDVTPKGIE